MLGRAIMLAVCANRPPSKTGTMIGYLAALVMGIVLGVLGGGGSILTVPILVYLCGIDATLATSYSLGIVGVTALVGAARGLRKKLVDFRVVWLFGAPSVVGVILARSLLLPIAPENVLHIGDFLLTRDLLVLILFAAFMVAAGVVMVRQQPVEIDSAARSLTFDRTKSSKILIVVVEGLVVGIFTGLVGAGGGFVIVPVLVAVLGLPIRLAIGTSLAIISLKSIAGVAADPMFWREADWMFLSGFTIAAVIGILLGGMLSSRIPAKPLKTAFGWFVLALGVFMLSKEIAF